MTFKSQMSVDMESVFLNTDEFAESIVYTPKNGVAKTIPAIIDRVPVNSQGEDQARTLHKQAEIIIHNDATNGVTSIDKNGDKVTFPALPGGTAIDWDVISIMEATESHWRLLITQ